jgi:cytosine/adenosine deaminase-related metal-dependent hydrolase
VDLIMRGRYLLADPREGPATISEDAAIAIKDGRVAEIGASRDLIARHQGVRVLGNGKQLLMPGLIDAHSHGRGLSPIQKGVLYDFLENNLLDWARMVVLPPELCAALCAVKHLRSGCTTIHHYGFNDEGPQAAANAERGVKAYLGTGIRLAYSPGVRNINRLTLEDADFVASLPSDLRQRASGYAAYDPARVADEYFTLFDHLHRTFNGSETKVILGPSWAHGQTEQFLRRAKQEADQRGKLPIHIHTLQTPHQRAYGEWKYGKSLVAFLGDCGLLDDNLVLSHAIYVTEADIERLGAARASITHHPSCNFNMRNGIAPIPRIMAAGINVALGIDDKGINDDEDAIMELRMAHKVHRLAAFDLANTPALDAFDVLRIGTVNAARVTGFGESLGALTPGMKADAILVDLDEILEDPWWSGDLNIAEMFVHRAKGHHVNSVVVGGKVVIENRQFRTIDVAALYREIRAVMERGLPPAQAEYARLMAEIKPYAQAWYARWQRGFGEPYYRLNAMN